MKGLPLTSWPEHWTLIWWSPEIVPSLSCTFSWAQSANFHYNCDPVSIVSIPLVKNKNKVVLYWSSSIVLLLFCFVFVIHLSSVSQFLLLWTLFPISPSESVHKITILSFFKVKSSVHHQSSCQLPNCQITATQRKAGGWEGGGRGQVWMCARLIIPLRPLAAYATTVRIPPPPSLQSVHKARHPSCPIAVSYTHLTLPTRRWV